jgi:hypothetical protein
MRRRRRYQSRVCDLQVRVVSVKCVYETPQPTTLNPKPIIHNPEPTTYSQPLNVPYKLKPTTSTVATAKPN